MERFCLIQRGRFENDGKSYIGLDSVVHLEYMGSSEFEWGAIPKAYRRVMYQFTEYDVFNTGIYTPEHEELMLLCRKDCSAEVIQAIRYFIEHPYKLKEYSELEKVPKARKEDTSHNRRCCNFWWCIDIEEPCGDWMAFLQPQATLLTDAVKNDYQNWWLNKSPEEREEEYEKSLNW